jgi:AI-2E family transporter/GAF domain
MEQFSWTLGLYLVLELLTSNVAEPWVYGSFTGISTIAILIAAVFWTWLWGPIGLVLSTPLTVCIMVIGRYVPNLEFVGILFGDEPALLPSQRFYQKANVVCISGVPPQTTRQVALRCKHLRRNFPDLTIVAAVWSNADLASTRSRIPVSDANHVVCNLRQAVDYIAPPIDAIASAERPSETEEPRQLLELKPPDTSDAPLQEVLDRLTQAIANALDVPIAILSLDDERGSHWESQCGLPADLAPDPSDPGKEIESLLAPDASARVIEDILQDDRFAKNTFLLTKGIHFYADVPLRTRNGKLVGSLRVLDTRPRQITEQDREYLEAAVLAAGEAVELRTVAPKEEPRAEPSAEQGPGGCSYA